MTTLYQDLMAAGCEIDNHESDLYVRATTKSAPIVKRHRGQLNIFESHDGSLWFDVPFAFDPWWQNKRRHIAATADKR